MTMKKVTAVVEITHGGKTITLKGSDAQAVLSRLMNWDGQGEIYLQYRDPDTNQLTGFKFCCDDTWRQLPNEVEEVETRDCGFDCADELAFASPKSLINHSTGKPLADTKPAPAPAPSNSGTTGTSPSSRPKPVEA